MTRAELKSKAKSQLRGNWGWAICLFLVGAIITGLITSINAAWIEPVADKENIVNMVQQVVTQGASLLSFVLGLITTMIGWGITYTILHFVDSGEKEQVFKGTFSGFTGGRIKNTFLTALLQEIFITLWT